MMLLLSPGCAGLVSMGLQRCRGSVRCCISMREEIGGGWKEESHLATAAMPERFILLCACAMGSLAPFSRPITSWREVHGLLVCIIHHWTPSPSLFQSNLP